MHLQTWLEQNADPHGLPQPLVLTCRDWQGDSTSCQRFGQELTVALVMAADPLCAAHCNPMCCSLLIAIKG
jgi:hypothetical protein